MNLSELNIKVEGLEDLINLVKENSQQNINLLATMLALSVAVLSLIGFSTLKLMVRNKFENFYEQNMESFRTEIRMETKRGLSSPKFRDDLIQEVKESLLDSDSISPTLLNGTTVPDEYPPTYRKVAEKFILFNMLLIVIQDDLMVFTLPVGYRPSENTTLVVPIKRAKGGMGTGFLKIKNNGSVSISEIRRGDTVLLENVFIMIE